MKVAAVDPQEPLTGETLLPNVKPNERTAKEVIELSRELWGREWKEDEETDNQKTGKGSQSSVKNEELAV